jgi:hypothetical protein
VLAPVRENARMHKTRFSLGLIFLAFAIGCDGGTAAVDGGPLDAATRDGGPTADAGRLDAGRTDGGRIDGGPTDGGRADAGPDASTTDASTELDAAIADAGTQSCPAGTAIEDFTAGVCDGRGIAGCTMWATREGGAAAVARCVPPEGRCARADSCTDAGCTCGGGPECGDDQMCVRGAGGAYACVCIADL